MITIGEEFCGVPMVKYFVAYSPLQESDSELSRCYFEMLRSDKVVPAIWNKLRHRSAVLGEFVTKYSAQDSYLLLTQERGLFWFPGVSSENFPADFARLTPCQGNSLERMMAEARGNSAVELVRIAKRLW